MTQPAVGHSVKIGENLANANTRTRIEALGQVNIYEFMGVPNKRPTRL